MPRESAECKEAILPKIALPQNLSVVKLANQEGISTATTDNSRKAAGERGAVLRSTLTPPAYWSSEKSKYRISCDPGRSSGYSKL